MPNRRSFLATAGVALLAMSCGSAEPAAPPTHIAFDPGEAGAAAFIRCLDREGAAIVSAHRGGPGPGYPENALETFERTLASAPAIIEVDVRVTRDGVPVLLHDERLDRTTTCTGPLADTTWEEAARCRLRDPDGRATDFTIPRLADALAWAEARTILQLDIKRNVPFDAVLDTVRGAGAQGGVIVITYSAAAAGVVARRDRRVAISAPVDDIGDLDRLADDDVEPSRLFAWTGTEGLDPALYERLDAAGVPVIFGTLGPPARSIDGVIERTGDDARYAEIAASGVDIVATDRPGPAAAALAAANDPSDEIIACQASTR